MKIIVAPDSFKGSLSAFEAAEAMQEGILAAYADAEIIALPIADGGEGTIDVLAKILKGELIYKTVPGPYGKAVNAHYFIDENRVAYIELAQASGLTLAAAKERNPLEASTYGTGFLIADALGHNVKRICLTLGGSATNDAGAGIAKAIGIQILNAAGEEVPATCAGLEQATKIDISQMDPKLINVEIVIASDVQNPLCGKNGASYIYGPQKGADANMVVKMDAIHKKFGKLIEAVSKRSLVDMPGSGAAGGAALPLLAFTEAKVISGIDMVLDAFSFSEQLRDASAVFTGEGKADMQTGFGKAIAGIHNRCQQKHVPLYVFAGIVEDVDKAAFPNTQFFVINRPDSPLADNMKNAYQNLKNTVTQVVRKCMLSER